MKEQKEKKMPNKLLTKQELAEYLNVKESTVYQWTHYRKIPYIKLGRFLRFDLDEVNEWLQEHKMVAV